MVASKLSISLSEELADVVRRLAAERGEDVSRLIEILLRENPLVQDAIERHRASPRPPREAREPTPGPKPDAVRVGVSLRGEGSKRSARSSKNA